MGINEWVRMGQPELGQTVVDSHWVDRYGVRPQPS